MTTPARSLLRIVVVAAIASLALGACTRTNSDFCCSTADSCAAFGDTEVTRCTDPTKSFCDDTGAYGPRNTCVPDPMTTECAIPSDCTNPARPFCIDQQCVECENNASCELDAPVCSQDTHVCFGCVGEADCADRAETPHCLEDTGACVACRDANDCGGATPVCDPDAHVCRVCREDADCGTDVCDTEAGTCIPESSVVFLSPQGGNSGTCTRAQPCMTFALGLAAVGGGRTIVKAAPGTYTGKAVIDGISVKILGDGATIQPAPTDQTVVQLTNTASATIRGLTINGASGPATGVGLKCDTGSTLTLTGATIKGNPGGGVSIAGCEYTLVNNVIQKNGSANSALGGVFVTQITTAGTHVFDFNTVTGNSANAGITPGVLCSVVTSPLTFSNSILYGNGNGLQLDGTNCAARYSDVGPMAAAGTGNINVDPAFVDGAAGDVHLSAESTLIDAADPQATVIVDIDGDPRPSGDGFDMGADERP